MTSTADLILEDALEAKRHPEQDRYREPKCPWCSSSFHGLPREKQCDGSRAHHDDSWRRVKRDDWTVREQAFMDDTGCDGWIARAMCKVDTGYSREQVMRSKIKAALLGRRLTEPMPE